MNIEDEVAQATHEWRDHAIDGTPLGSEPFCNCYDYARAIMPLVKRAQAEAWDAGFTRGFYSGQAYPDGSDASEPPSRNPYESEATDV